MQWLLLGHQMSLWQPPFATPPLQNALRNARNVSIQKALHTFRKQSKYKLNFLLKDNGLQIFKQNPDRVERNVKWRVNERGRESETKGERERESGRERAEGLLSLSSFVILSKNENINSQRVICAHCAKGSSGRRTLPMSMLRRCCSRCRFQRGNSKPNATRWTWPRGSPKTMKTNCIDRV